MMIPLWLGVLPFGFAFAVLARAAGFSVLETQLFSAVLFAGSSQVASVSLAAAGSNPLAIVATAGLLNARHLLYGLSLGPRLPQRLRPPRALLAFVLTDEAYGVTVRAFQEGRGSDAVLFGASCSLYITWNAATLTGSLVGGVLPDPTASGLDFIFPLTFLALLVPLLRGRVHLLVAAVGGGVALALSRVAPGGMTILIATVVAALAGMAVERRGGGDTPGNGDS